MAKRTTTNKDIVKVNPMPGVPDYLASYVEEDSSLSEMKQYRIVPRLKVVQNTAAQSLLEVFSPGDVIVTPGNAMVVPYDKGNGDPFLFVPVYFFVEFVTFSDLKDNESPTILDRSFDTNGEIAKKSRDPQLRTEKYDGNRKKRHCEHLNFVGIIYNEDNPLHGEICTLCFSRGEFSKGRSFVNSCTLRKGPLWSQVWQFVPRFRNPSPDKKWFGLDFETPADAEPFIGKNDVERFKSLHDELKTLHEEKKLRVNLEDVGEDDVEPDNDDSDM